MKTLKLIFSLIFILCNSSGLSAADLIVEEGAILPNYATIQAAVDAASPGDRIFIKNKSLNIPYLETVTIDKPLGLFPLDPTDPWLLTGGITIAPDPAEFSTENEITIQGAHIISGSITSTTASDALADIARLNIISNEMDDGVIDIDDDNLETHASGNQLNSGSMTIGYGVVSANQVAGTIAIADINQGTSDTTWVVGNRIINSANSYPGQIFWDNDDNFIYIANNYIRYNGTNNRAIYIVDHRGGGPGGHTIINNTIETGTSYTDGIYIFSSITSGTQFTISNNAFLDATTGEPGSTGEYAIDLPSTISNSSIVLITHNVHENYDGGFIDRALPLLGVYTESNFESTSGTFDPDDITGECLDVDCINLGSPDNRYTDLDLSRNDIGTAGGSFSFNNFWPILTGGARVYMVKTPRSIIEGTTIDVEVDGYDR